MRFRALRTKKSPKEFVVIELLGDKLCMLTCGLPNPLPITATIEGMKEYYKKDNLEFLDDSLTWNDIEMIEYEMFEVNTEKYYREIS